MGFIALLVELGLPVLMTAGAVSVSAAGKVRRKKQLKCVPTDDGYYYAGVLIGPREIRRPEYKAARAYLRQNADKLGLTAAQRRAVAA